MTLRLKIGMLHLIVLLLTWAYVGGLTGLVVLLDLSALSTVLVIIAPVIVGLLATLLISYMLYHNIGGLRMLDSIDPTPVDVIPKKAWPLVRDLEDLGFEKLGDTRTRHFPQDGFSQSYQFVNSSKTVTAEVTCLNTQKPSDVQFFTYWSDSQFVITTMTAALNQTTDKFVMQQQPESVEAAWQQHLTAVKQKKEASGQPVIISSPEQLIDISNRILLESSFSLTCHRLVLQQWLMSILIVATVITGGLLAVALLANL